MSSFGLNVSLAGISQLANVDTTWLESAMAERPNKAPTDPMPTTDAANNGATPPPPADATATGESVAASSQQPGSSDYSEMLFSAILG